jgi:hypothetical protein
MRFFECNPIGIQITLAMMKFLFPRGDLTAADSPGVIVGVYENYDSKWKELGPVVRVAFRQTKVGWEAYPDGLSMDSVEALIASPNAFPTDLTWTAIYNGKADGQVT